MATRLIEIRGSKELHDSQVYKREPHVERPNAGRTGKPVMDYKLSHPDVVQFSSPSWPMLEKQTQAPKPLSHLAWS